MRGRTVGIAVILVAVVAIAVWQRMGGTGLFDDAAGRQPGAGGTAPSGTNENAYAVRADFNGDGLIDRAVAETDARGRNCISIYLRRDTDDPRRQYYKIGHIQNPGEFSASAIMSVQGAGRNDLMVILLHGDKRRELVHYRSQGELFVELQREWLDRASER